MVGDARISTMTAEAKVVRRFQPLFKMGEGSCAVVMRCLDLQTCQVVAVKRMRDPDSEEDIARMDHEFRMHGRMKRAGLTEGASMLLMAFRTPKTRRLALVFRAHDITLSKRMMTRNKHWPMKEVATVLRHLLQLLARWKKHALVHADLVPANMMFDYSSSCSPGDALKPTVIDFGMARFYGASDLWVWSDPERYLQTANYRSPEVTVQAVELYGPAMDVWSLGCVALGLACNRTFFRSCTGRDLLEEHVKLLGAYPDAVLDKAICLFGAFERCGPENKWTCTLLQRPADIFVSSMLHEGCSAAFIDLMRRMLALDPRQRIEPEAALQHAFFADGQPSKQGTTTSDPGDRKE